MKARTLNSLWRQNPMLVGLLGLSPLLAVSHSLVTALGLGLATLAVMLGSALPLTALRSRLPQSLVVPAVLLVIATATAAVDLCLQAFFAELHAALGLYVPLIAVNGAVLLLGVGSAPTTARRAVLDALAAGLGMLLALALLGSMRELLGKGTLFDDFDLLFGKSAAGWALRPLPTGYAFPFWTLPAGGFVAAGLVLALLRRLASGRPESTPITPAARARVTATAAMPDDPGEAPARP